MTQQTYQPTDRRPLASRQQPFWQKAAAVLASAGASPNKISIAGLFCGIAAGVCLLFTAHADRWQRVFWLAAVAGTQLRLAANLLDGMVAVASGRASAVGELYNEIPDRISDAVILIGAGYAAGGDSIAGYVAACLAIMTAYIRAVGKTAGASNLFIGPMAKPHRMFVITVACLYMALSPVSWRFSLNGQGVMAMALWIICLGAVITCVRRLIRIARHSWGTTRMIDQATRQRLFGWSDAFDHPLVKGAVICVAAALVITPVLFWTLTAIGKLNPTLRKELWARYFSWLLLVPMMFVPILLGAAWTIAAVCIMSLLCYREFARATGIFRDSITSGVVVVGIVAVYFAVADNWYAFFVALTPLTIAFIAATAVIRDQPKGYIQRVALAVFAYLLFGVCYGYLGYFANDKNFRPLLVWLVINVELNDIFAYIVGKNLGHRKLAPNTSPNKTLAGSIGALVLTTTLTALTGHLVFRGSNLDRLPHLIMLGLLMSATGQLGDLTLSSIKRDLGIKDWAATFPGHGGLLDRFNSMLFAAPAIFHYVGYYQGIGLDQQRRIFTGG